MFGELICGPPGSGKTTYCEGKRQFLSVYDPSRPVIMLNLDPANEGVFPYPCDVDVRELVDHSRIMEEENLGPNGAYLFCATVMQEKLPTIMKSIEAAVEERIKEVIATGNASVRAPYLLVDCPGQVEFYINSSVIHSFFRSLQKQLQCTLCTVHLVDAGIATRDLPTYASSCLLSLTTMVDHELPHVNVLTKWDTLTHADLADEDDGHSFLNASSFVSEDFDRLWKKQLRRKRQANRMATHFVTAEHPAPRLTISERNDDAALESIDLKKDGGRVYRFTRLLMEVIEGYSLVGFVPLDVQNQEMMVRLTQEIDNAVGNFF